MSSNNLWSLQLTVEPLRCTSNEADTTAVCVCVWWWLCSYPTSSERDCYAAAWWRALIEDLKSNLKTWKHKGKKLARPEPKRWIIVAFGSVRVSTLPSMFSSCLLTCMGVVDRTGTALRKWRCLLLKRYVLRSRCVQPAQDLACG